jgi:hypothetical protein
VRVAATNTAFMATFKHIVTRTFDPDFKKWVMDLEETIGEVCSPTYPTTAIPLQS